MSKPILIKARKTALAQAKAFQRALTQLNKRVGGELLVVDNLLIREEVDSSGDKSATVYWEEGPFEWSIMLSGGESILASELGRYGMSPEFEFEAGHRYWEPKNNYSATFYSFEF